MSKLHIQILPGGREMSLHHLHFGWAAGLAPAKREHKHVKEPGSASWRARHVD